MRAVFGVLLSSIIVAVIGWLLVAQKPRIDFGSERILFVVDASVAASDKSLISESALRAELETSRGIRIPSCLSLVDTEVRIAFPPQKRSGGVDIGDGSASLEFTMNITRQRRLLRVPPWRLKQVINWQCIGPHEACADWAVSERVSAYMHRSDPTKPEVKLVAGVQREAACGIVTPW
jgi:hypothetical protein